MRLEDWLEKNLKSIIITFGVVAFLAYFFFTGLFQRQVAFTVTSIHVAINYSDKGLSFRDLRHAQFTSEYIVTFVDSDGERVDFWVSPDIFPIVIVRNSLEPGA